VNFDAPQALIGQFADVLITEALSNSLRGRLVGSEEKKFHTEISETTESRRATA
jgi:hypothetical protein